MVTLIFEARPVGRESDRCLNRKCA